MPWVGNLLIIDLVVVQWSRVLCADASAAELPHNISVDIGVGNTVGLSPSPGPGRVSSTPQSCILVAGVVGGGGQLGITVGIVNGQTLEAL